MKKKTRVLIISYTAALVAALAVGLIACRTDANRRQTAMDANYRHAYGEVLNAVQELDSSLQKSLYATTAAMECTVCTDIYSAAQTAEMALGVLPVNSHALERIARNIALAGDYARTLSRNAAEGRTFTSEELEHLRAFSDATKQLSTQLAALGQSLYDGAVTTTAHVRSTESLENLGSEADLSDTLEAELAALADSFEELPLPIADGSYQVRTAADYAMLARSRRSRRRLRPRPFWTWMRRACRRPAARRAPYRAGTLTSTTGTIRPISRSRSPAGKCCAITPPVPAANRRFRPMRRQKRPRRFCARAAMTACA